MTEWLLQIAVALVGLPLIVSGWVHFRAPAHFRAAVVAQATLPFRWHSALAACFTASEICVGAAAVIQVAGGYRLTTISAALLFFVYAAISLYVGIVLMRRGSVPCGCFGGSSEMSLVTLGRAILLSGCSLALALAAQALVNID